MLVMDGAGGGSAYSRRRRRGGSGGKVPQRRDRRGLLISLVVVPCAAVGSARAMPRRGTGLYRFLSLLRRGMFASDRWVHVGEGAMRVRFPGPDMQFVERAEAIAIGRADEVEELTV